MILHTRILYICTQYFYFLCTFSTRISVISPSELCQYVPLTVIWPKHRWVLLPGSHRVCQRCLNFASTAAGSVRGHFFSMIYSSDPETSAEASAVTVLLPPPPASLRILNFPMCDPLFILSQKLPCPVYWFHEYSGCLRTCCGRADFHWTDKDPPPACKHGPPVSHPRSHHLSCPLLGTVANGILSAELCPGTCFWDNIVTNWHLK